MLKQRVRKVEVDEDVLLDTDDVWDSKETVIALVVEAVAPGLGLLDTTPLRPLWNRSTRRR